jgi:hypothetical protein
MDQAKERRAVAFRPEYVPVVDGDLGAALMLSQIVYWYLPSSHTGESKLRVNKKSGWWIAKSHKDWEFELGMSRRQSQRCLGVLIEKGLIEKDTFRFNGSPTVHVRLCLLQGQNLLTDAPTPADFGYVEPEEPVEVPEEPLHCTPDSGGLHHPEQTITENTTGITTGIKHEEILSPESALSAPPEKLAGKTGENNTEGLTGPTTKGVLKGAKFSDLSMGVATEIVVNDQQQPVGGKVTVKAKDTLALLQGKKQIVSLPGYWKECVSLLQNGKYQKALSVKEAAQLKTLSKQLGEMTVPVIHYAINNWSKFAEKAKNAKDLGSYPLQPHVGFLLTHHDVAVNLLQSIATQKKAVPAVSSEGTNKVIIEKNQEKPYKPTQEDLDAFLAGLEK